MPPKKDTKGGGKDKAAKSASGGSEDKGDSQEILSVPVVKICTIIRI